MNFAPHELWGPLKGDFKFTWKDVKFTWAQVSDKAIQDESWQAIYYEDMWTSRVGLVLHIPKGLILEPCVTPRKKQNQEKTLAWKSTSTRKNLVPFGWWKYPYPEMAKPDFFSQDFHGSTNFTTAPEAPLAEATPEIGRIFSIFPTSKKRTERPKTKIHSKWMSGKLYIH